MTLAEAIGILLRVHTRHDEEVGTLVMMGATPTFDVDCSTAEYIQAWTTLATFHKSHVEFVPTADYTNVPPNDQAEGFINALITLKINKAIKAERDRIVTDLCNLRCNPSSNIDTWTVTETIEGLEAIIAGDNS